MKNFAHFLLITALLTTAVFAQRQIPSSNYYRQTQQAETSSSSQMTSPQPPQFRTDMQPRQTQPSSSTGNNATGHSIGIFGGVSPIQNHFQETTIGTAEADLDSDDDNLSWLAGLKYGYDFPIGDWILGFEVEGFYLDHEVDATTFGVLPVMADMDVAVGLVSVLVKKDFGKLRPYVGLGIGGGHAWLEEGTVTQTEYTSELLAFQVPVGAEYFITDNFALSMDYRMLMLQGIDDEILGGAVETELDIILHTFTAGLRTYF